MGVSPTTRDTFFFSCVSSGLRRWGCPAPTRTIPQRPTTRCTASKFVVAATAWLTRHPERSWSRAHAAAPGCPSALANTVFCTRREKMIIAAMTPVSTPSGSIHHWPPQSMPRRKNTTAESTTAPIISGHRSLSCLVWILSACHIWPRCSLPACRLAARAAFLSALPPSLFAMPHRIRGTCGGREPRPRPPGGQARRPRGVRPAPTPPGESGPTARQDSRRLLCGGALRGQVLEIGRHVLPPVAEGLHEELARAVRGADQRPGHDARETDLPGLVGQFDELLRLDPAVDRVVERTGPQVLGDGEDVAARGVQVAHRLDHLVRGLAHPQDEVGLGDQPEVAGGTDDIQGTLIPERRTDPLEHPRHGLEVVCQHLGPGLEHL